MIEEVCIHCQTPLALFELQNGRHQCLACFDPAEEDQNDEEDDSEEEGVACYQE